MIAVISDLHTTARVSWLNKFVIHSVVMSVDDAYALIVLFLSGTTPPIIDKVGIASFYRNLPERKESNDGSVDNPCSAMETQQSVVDLSPHGSVTHKQDSLLMIPYLLESLGYVCSPPVTPRSSPPATPRSFPPATAHSSSPSGPLSPPSVQRSSSLPPLRSSPPFGMYA